MFHLAIEGGPRVHFPEGIIDRYVPHDMIKRKQSHKEGLLLKGRQEQDEKSNELYVPDAAEIARDALVARNTKRNTPPEGANIQVYKGQAYDEKGQILPEGRTVRIHNIWQFLRGPAHHLPKYCTTLPYYLFNMSYKMSENKTHIDVDHQHRLNAHIGDAFKEEVRLLMQEDAYVTFLKNVDFRGIMARAFGVSVFNPQLQALVEKTCQGVMVETNWDNSPYTGKLQADILGILRYFGLKDFDDKKLLGDAVVIARVLEDAALRITGKPYFHDEDRGLMPEEQVRQLVFNLVKFARTHWLNLCVHDDISKIDFTKPFPEELRAKVTKPMLWLVEEDYTIGAVKLSLLMPYIIFSDTILTEIDAQLNGAQTLKTAKVKVENDAFVAGSLNVTDGAEFTCSNFITYMNRDYGTKTLYNTSNKHGREKIESVVVVPTITFRDHEQLNFGKKLSVKACNNIVNDAGRLVADVMYFQAGGDMVNTGEMAFVDSFVARINGNFTNDIIVIVEHETVHGVHGHRTYTGQAARNQIKNNSGQIIAIGDSSKDGMFDLKTGGNFTHRGIIDVGEIKLNVGKNLNVQNLPDQFIVKWDPGGKAKEGQDCFSVASQFTPSEMRARDGSINIVVGGEAKVYASLLSAKDDILVTARKLIDLQGRGESYVAGINIDNKRRERRTTEESGIIIQKVQVEANGNVRMIARENIDIKGGDLLAGLELYLEGKNINIRPIQIVAENHVNKYGTRGFSYYENDTIYSTAEVASSELLAKNITMNATNDINIQGSMMMAMDDIRLTAGNDINIIEDLVEHYIESSNFTAHLRFFGSKTIEKSMQRQFVAARRAFRDEFSNLCQLNHLIHAKHGVDYGAEGIKAILGLYEEYKAINEMGFGNYCKQAAVQKIAQAGLHVEMSEEKKNWTEAILPVMKARSILMKAGRNINMRGVQAEAENMKLEALGNITIEAAQEYYTQKETCRRFGIHAQANFDAKNDKFLAPTVGISAGYSSASNQSVTHRNAHINVQQFEAVTPGTLKLEGATINATDVKIVANALLMKSLRDTQNGRHKSVSGGIDVNLSNGAVSGHVEGSRGSYSKAKVNEQTGITALGEFIAEIGDVTHLQGAFIDAANGSLKTNRLIHSDIDEHDQRKQMDFGVGNFDFSRNSAYILPDVSYNSKNQKGRLKAGVSSGVQIVTQSDISNLNRDLSRAREIVKDHKHHVRVVVPIPGEVVGAVMEGFAGIGERLKRAFDVLTTDQVPKFIRDEIKEDLRVYEEIQAAKHLNDEEKEYGWNHYKAVKQAERYGVGFLTGKDLEGNDRHGEVRIVDNKVEITYSVYQKEVFAQRLTKAALFQQREEGNIEAYDRIEKQMVKLLDVYNNNEKLDDFNTFLLQHCQEFRDQIGLNALQARQAVDGDFKLQKVFAPLLGGAIGNGIAGGAAGGAAIASTPSLEGLFFAGPVLAKLLYNAKEHEVRGLLKDKIAADKLTAPDHQGGHVESFPPHQENGQNTLWTPDQSDQFNRPNREIYPGNLQLPTQTGESISGEFNKPQVLSTPNNGPQGLIILEQEGYENHHVIPKSLKHRALDSAGVNHEDENNKKCLPTPETEEKDKTGKSMHKGRHGKDYFRQINKGLDKVAIEGDINNWSMDQRRNGLYKFLDVIKEKLDNGKIHVNKKCEERYYEIHRDKRPPIDE